MGGGRGDSAAVFISSVPFHASPLRSPLSPRTPRKRRSVMRQRVYPVALVALLLLAPALPAGSQELRGRITGVVTDNTGAVLPGASVTIAGPALIQPQTTVTAADGTYRYPALPPGLYTVTFELTGFQTLRREEIRLGLNQTLSVDAQLPLSSLQETVTITGESPTVDVKSTTVGTNFTRELLQDIPNARDVWAAMAQAPGVQMTAYDVGGSHTGTQTGYQTYGVGDQNKTLLEGINVTEGTNGNAGYFDFGSFEEFQLGGSGNMGEQSGVGAFLNLTIKSGGDKFAAQVYYDYLGDRTLSNNVPDAFRTPGGVDASGFQPLRDLSLAIPVSAANWQDSRNRPQKIEWTSTLSSRAFLDLQVSHWGNYFPLYPTQTKSTSVDGVPVGRTDLDTEQRSGASDYYHNRTTLKPQFSGALSYFVDRFAGSHNFKIGAEVYRERRNFLRFQPGNIYYRDRGTMPSEVDIYNT